MPATAFAITMKKTVCLLCLLASLSLGKLLAQPAQEPPEIRRIMKQQANFEARLDRQEERWEKRQMKQGNLIIDYFIEEDAQFLGGPERLHCFLSNFIHYPDSAKKAGICGTVIVNFCVEKDGTVKIAEAKQKVHPMLDAEAVRGVKRTSGLWQPQRVLGDKKRHWFNVPVRFQCSNDSDTIISKNNCDFTLFEWHSPFRFRSAFQNGDSTLVPLHFDKSTKALAVSDSLTFIRILQQLNPDEDVIVHLWTYRNYYYPENYINSIVHQYAPRAALVVTHHTGFSITYGNAPHAAFVPHNTNFGHVRRSYKYERHYQKILDKYPYITYAVIVKV